MEGVTSGTQSILSAFLQGKPFAVGKLGSNELQITVCYLQDCDGLGSKESVLLQYRREVMYNLATGAGIYPCRLGQCYTYVEHLMNDLIDLDYCAVWDSQISQVERGIVKSQNPHFTEIGLTDIEPYRSDIPWTYFLRGKKVLVVSCFAETIEKQYAHRDKIWGEGAFILPDFTLKTLYFPHSYYVSQSASVSPDTIHTIPINTSLSVGGEHVSEEQTIVTTYPADWNTLLEQTVRRIREIDYDICLIGAGAYGVPLAVECKRQGKIGIHMGGALQILFGVRGGRWDANTSFHKYFNEYWVYPMKHETPIQANLVENRCYYRP